MTPIKDADHGVTRPAESTSAARPWNVLPKFRARQLQQFSILLGFLGVYIVFSVLSPVFLTPDNLTAIAVQSSMNAVIAVGMTLVIITAGIDLSVGSIVGFSSVVAASFMVGTSGVAEGSVAMPIVGSGNILTGVIVGVLVGVVCGFVNAGLIAKVKLPPFIATLGTLSLFRGIALVYSNGYPVYNLPTDFRNVFAGYLGPIPTTVLIALAVAVAAQFLLRGTSLGEHILAVGGNEEAARLAGVPVRRVKTIVYAISGLMCTIGGFILISRIGTAEPTGGVGFELDAIGAAAIGGASLFGGKGSIVGTVLGALILGGLRNGLTLLNVQSYYQQVATGVVIILAVFLDQLTKERR